MAIFESDRLEAVEWTLEDAPAALAIYGDPEVTAGLSGEIIPTIEAMRERLARIADKYEQVRPLGFWAIRRKNNGIIGAVLLQPLPGYDEIEVGWHLAREHWGNGFATEAAYGALSYGFENLDLSEVFAVVRPWNTRSIAVAKRLGMESLGLTNRYYETETELFRIRSADFLAAKAGPSANQTSENP